MWGLKECIMAEVQESHDEEDQAITAVVPRFDDLIVKCIAENYDIYPALDRIPPEYVDNVVVLLDPAQIEFTAAAKYITTEKFWKRFSQERWPICQIDKHGLSWKRLFIERHLQALLEAYYPSKNGQNFQKLTKELDAGKPFVHSLNIQQLLSHVDLSDVLIEFPHLSTLVLKYGARKIGMDYDKTLFGMQLKDAMHLSKFISKTRILTKLVLTENLLTDESVHILSAGLAKNDTLTYIDLSHNKIGDQGATRIANLLGDECVLTHLDLGDNHIHAAGGKALGTALEKNDTITHFSLKLNPLGDEGGVAVLTNLAMNENLTSLDLSGTNMQVDSCRALCKLMSSNNELKKIDFSCNSFASKDSASILRALESNKSLTEMNMRKSGVNSAAADDIRAILKKRFAASKQKKRQAYQKGWDEML